MRSTNGLRAGLLNGAVRFCQRFKQTRPSHQGTDVDLLVVMNGPWLGLSGGDIHALRLLDKARELPIRAIWMGPSWALASSPVPAPEVIDTALRLDKYRKTLPAYLLLLMARTVKAVGHRSSPRVTVAASHFLQDVVPAISASRRSRSLYCYVYHLVGDSPDRKGLRSVLSRGFERISLSLLRRVGARLFYGNEEVRLQLQAHGFEDRLLYATENAVAVPSGFLRSIGKSDEKIVLTCGRLTVDKGAEDFAHLAVSLARAHPSARFVMLGDGPLRDRLISTAQESGIKLEVRGFVSEDEKWSLLSQASLFVAPSHEEGWGIAIEEAVAAGVPVVGYDLPVYVRFGSAIQRVPRGDGHALTRVVGQFLEQGRDLEYAADDASPFATWHQILDSDLHKLGLI